MNKKIRSLVPFVGFFLPWGVYFSILWLRMLVITPKGLFAGHPYVWADWSMHLALASNFAYRPVQHWFDSLPVYAGARVTYPFVSNLFSGLFLHLGFSYPLAFLLPSLLVTMMTLVILYRFYTIFLRSTLAACLASTILLCSGGIGAFLLVREKGLEVLLDPTITLTQIPALAIEVNTLVASMLIPQRAFLFGLPLGLLLLNFLYTEFLMKKKVTTFSKLHYVGMGLLAGLLPIIHTHTYLVIVFASLWIGIVSLNSIKRWLFFAGPAAVLSFLLYLVFLKDGVSGSSFFSFVPGWYVHDGLIAWMWFWVKNWGLFLGVALLGTVWVRRHESIKLFYFVCFFWALFILGNLVQFQPQIWDNTKIFAWVYVGLTIPVVVLLSALYRVKIVGKLITALVVGILIFSGALDLIHNLDSEKKTFQMLSSDEISLGVAARDLIPAEASVLTPATVTNPISMIGGRSVLLGYPGWAFSYGLSYADREADIVAAYQGSQALDVVASRYQATYVYVPSSTGLESIPTTLIPVFRNNAGTIYHLQ